MLEYSTSLKTKTEQCIQIHMFTYWHIRNLRGSVVSKIPLGCFSQHEPAAERPPEDLWVCVFQCVCVCVCVYVYERVQRRRRSVCLEGSVLPCINMDEEIKMFSASGRWCEPDFDFLSILYEVFLLYMAWPFCLLCLPYCLFPLIQICPQKAGKFSFSCT